MSCMETQIYSEEYLDLLIDSNLIENYIFPECMQYLDSQFCVGYYPQAQLPVLNVTAYGYNAIPNVFCLTDTEALDVTNIVFLQNQPVLDLKGRNVMVGFVDTGISYQNPLFRNVDGTTRIEAIWDQTQTKVGNLPEGFLYGTEYTREEINAALAADEPMAMVPTEDSHGHGTFLAGVACGGQDPGGQFVGAAPFAAIAVVKCKQAKSNLREFYHIPADAVCYQENDIMAGVAWLRQLAEARRMPLVVCIAMGSGLGCHTGDGPLSVFLHRMGLRRGCAIVAAVGNEANARHHYESRGMLQDAQEEVEIYVGAGVTGFVLELWAAVPELYQVGVVSPTGEVFRPQGGTGAGGSEDTFLFEGTRVSLEYDIVVGEDANQLAFLRFTDPMEGIWRIQVKAVQVIQGMYNMWLPMSQLMSGQVFFLRSTPDITATVPSFARSVIAVGAYRTQGGSLYPESGRGFGASGEIKPDLVAPGVNVSGPDRRGNLITMTGTSVSAAITAGACAQLLEWGIVKNQYRTLNSSELRTILTRGARRDASRSYPSREWGFGTLDVLAALEQLRTR